MVALLVALIAGLALTYAVTRHDSPTNEATAPATATPTPSDTASPSATSSASTTPTPTPPPTSTPGPTAHPVGTYAVETVSMTFVDTSRGTMARGPRPATGERTLLTMIRFPATGTGTGSPDGPFPLVVFAEGFNISTAPYAPMLNDLASRGYVVAAPEFPLATTIYEGPASQADLDNEPADVSFVLDQVLRIAAEPGVINGLVDKDRVAVMGHSDGAAVAAVIGYDPTFRDRRFKAAVILSGQAGDIHSQPGLDGSPPLLVAHGTADEINPYWIGPAIHAAVSPPHYLLTIAGARHLEPFTDAPIRPAISEVIAAFLDLHLRGISTAAETLTAAGNAPGLTLTP